MIYFPFEWRKCKVLDWLLERGLVQGALCLNELAREQGLCSVIVGGRLVWAYWIGGGL